MTENVASNALSVFRYSNKSINNLCDVPSNSDHLFHPVTAGNSGSEGDV